ncbi:cytochrome-c oxidase, cbb3-type subunit II [Microvirga sp. STS02]|nr:MULTISPECIES: cytochrome-c oxidase, cbb3-type subunit II [Bacteria]MBR7207177.1 cytochrome-c oxidase, cbb3-type subunit II [Microvirga sp. STS02]
MNRAVDTFFYDNKIVRDFGIATVIWGIIGMAVGVLAAFELARPEVNMGTAYTTFGRIRPLHTNAVIFAFVGNGIFTGVYYSLQRLCKTRMFSDVLSKIHFWGWQLIILSAVATLPLGFTTSKEYAELEWPIDIAITLIWVVFGWNMFGTIARRRERHLYVGIWFYIATFLTVAVLHLVNSAEVPVSWLKSYSAYAGVQDALVQWWYGHNAVAFFLTTPYLGLMYWLWPRLYKTPLFSKKLATTHFWLGTLGILFYAIPMYWAGFTQGLMWKQFNAEGMLQYPNFLETVLQLVPMYYLRGIGGVLYLSGVFLLMYNLYKTAQAGTLLANEKAQAPALLPEAQDPHVQPGHWHRWLERRPFQLAVGATVAIAIGGAVEMIPTFLVKSNVPTIASVKPYRALELQGRDLYIREGCSNCHTQMVRPFRSETERYGEYSKAGEYVYDRPFLWGSKRTGPDLQRVGQKYPNSWHYNHMLDPTSMSPGSIMPPYPWLFENTIDYSTLPNKIRVLQGLNTPYPAGFDKLAVADAQAQARGIVAELKKEDIEVKSDKEIVALIAYLQRLGTDIKVKQ